MASLEDLKKEFAVAVEVWLPDVAILNFTHASASQATLDFLINQNSLRTKEHYFRIVKAFLAWADANILPPSSLAHLTTAQVKSYSEGLLLRKGKDPAKGITNRTRAQVLSCLRGYFNKLVEVGALPFNPVLSVKDPHTSATRGAFPPLPADAVMRLLESFREDSLQDLQDRAVIGLMAFGCARVSAVTKLKHSDVWEEAGRYVVKLEEKGENPHVVPLNAEANRYLRTFLAKSCAGAQDCDPNPEGFVFRRWSKGRKVLTSRPLDRLVCYRMVKRRAAALGITHPKLGNHTFRATGITTFINAEGTLEEARRLANHASTNTTRLYDHNNHGVKTRDVDLIDYRRK